MNNSVINILGIESSCDDTSAAVLCNNRVMSNIVSGQDIHKAYGGVVPELASRAHQQNIVPVVDTALRQAHICKSQLHAIAYTKGPGLLGSLLVGSSFAKSLSIGLQIPLIEVHHMQAHILAHFIEDASEGIPSFPFLGITISGGHTQIIQVDDYFKMKVIGRTLDDAIGEAFDKSAKILGLPYPGGPLIDQYTQSGNPKAFPFPKPKVGGLDFSFSGLKTSILYFIQKQTAIDSSFTTRHRDDLCASIQNTIISILMEKIQAAVTQTGISRIAIGGGVSANSGIRDTLRKFAQTHKWEVFIPKPAYTTDNAAMIGIVGYFKYQRALFSSYNEPPQARYNL